MFFCGDKCDFKFTKTIFNIKNQVKILLAPLKPLMGINVFYC
ncbi:hypothetical protein PROVRUST_05299 [Providencia rustigianii DSM 4541]|uniref:Uncharacterized protein n=1 Tax=Providencia rustigianii DSM 4541 TaxID=500637 RepID=D1NZE5_9GAMM|nr:hypothetical protein PROVRUST_05299 [Providencia rustigianii DSM 4541]